MAHGNGQANDHFGHRDGGWDLIRDKLRQEDEKRNAYLTEAMHREMTCDFCDARLPRGNSTGHCTAEPCRIRAKRYRSLAQESRARALLARQSESE